MKKLFFLFLFLIPCFLPAQEISITSQQIPQKASFSQPFDVSFAITHTPGYSVQLDKASLPKDFALTHKQLETLSPTSDIYHLTFLPFTLGVSTFTAINIHLQNTDKQNVATASSQLQNIEVAPVQFYKDQTLRDIRPPYIPFGWIWYVLGVACLLALIWLLKRYLRRKKTQQLLATSEQDNRPADVIALSKIRLLLQSGLWEKAQYKTFYIELGDILREYLWRRFALDVSADTSSELMRRVRNMPEMKPFLQQLRSYLSSSDLVKFAKVVPTQHTMQQDVKTIETLVRNTAIETTVQVNKEGN